MSEKNAPWAASEEISFPDSSIGCDAALSRAADAPSTINSDGRTSHPVLRIGVIVATNDTGSRREVVLTLFRTTPNFMRLNSNLSTTLYAERKVRSQASHASAKALRSG